MVASTIIHAFLEFFTPVLHTIFFSSHRMLSHITIVKVMDSCKREMNPVQMTVNHSLKKKNWPSWGSNQKPTFLKSSKLPTELKVLGFLTLYHTYPEKNKAFENIVGKEKTLVTSIFSFSHNVFYPIREKNQNFSNIQFGPV